MIKISKQFVDKYNSGKPQLIWEFIVADLETPVSALLKLTNNKDYNFRHIFLSLKRVVIK